MRKKISLRMWLSVFFGGIWQFIRNIFSWKNKTPFWRVIWATITVCIVAFTCMLGYAFYDEFVRRSGYRYSWEDRYDSDLSPYFKYRNNGHNEGKSYIYDSRTKKKVIKDIDCIIRILAGRKCRKCRKCRVTVKVWNKRHVGLSESEYR